MLSPNIMLSNTKNNEDLVEGANGLLLLNAIYDGMEPAKRKCLVSLHGPYILRSDLFVKSAADAIVLLACWPATEGAATCSKQLPHIHSIKQQYMRRVQSSSGNCGFDRNGVVKFYISEFSHIKKILILCRSAGLLKVSGSMMNTGHSVIFTVENDTRHHINVTGGPLSYKYQFQEIHIHYGLHDQFGSEHSINGYAFPAELKLHINSIHKSLCTPRRTMTQVQKNSSSDNTIQGLSTKFAKSAYNIPVMSPQVIGMPENYTRKRKFPEITIFQGLIQMQQTG
ncbi:unnamed protein product [Phaedon cochleariae]|uniref:Alpha-carbonic anhydrase domain-containing protein n=1 Tax=Phaedon cochleariae TaxID=80249 RepID=A0A9N9X343_PHACE|nr:unnamed protein product [Phaedon cochleariae]